MLIQVFACPHCKNKVPLVEVDDLVYCGNCQSYFKKITQNGKIFLSKSPPPADPSETAVFNGNGKINLKVNRKTIAFAGGGAIIVIVILLTVFFIFGGSSYTHPTPTMTNTATATLTLEPTASPTISPSPMPSATATITPPPTATFTPTITSTPTITPTPLPEYLARETQRFARQTEWAATAQAEQTAWWQEKRQSKETPEP